MSWASHPIEKLLAGETVQFRPRGQSMMPLIKSGALVTVAPATLDAVRVGDIVLCKVRGIPYLHLVRAKRDGQVQIGNNHGHINGWTCTVFGRCVAVED